MKRMAQLLDLSVDVSVAVLIPLSLRAWKCMCAYVHGKNVSIQQSDILFEFEFSFLA